MEKLEIKIKINNAEFEMKGNLDDVLQMYMLFREDIDSRGSSDSKPNLKVIDEQFEEPAKDISSKSPKKSKNKKKTAKFELTDLHENFKTEDFMNEFSKYTTKSSKAKILIAAYIYKELYNEIEFNVNLIHTLLNKLAIDTPKSLHQMLINYVNLDKLTERTTDNNYKLKFVGVNYCKDQFIKDDE